MPVPSLPTGAVPLCRSRAGWRSRQADPGPIFAALISPRRGRVCQPNPDWNPKPALMNPLQFPQQTRNRVAKVAWPTRCEVVLTTAMVFILSAIAATFLSLADLRIRTGPTYVAGA